MRSILAAEARAASGRAGVVIDRVLPPLLVVLILAGTFQASVNRRMHQRVAEAIDVYVESMSIAVSDLRYGLKGYIGYETIRQLLATRIKETPGQVDIDVLMRNMQNPALLNSALAEALTLDDVASRGTHTMRFSELAFIDYIRASFSMFGYRIEGLFYLYWLLLLTQVAVFYFAFRTERLLMAVLLLFAISHALVVMAANNMGKELWTVHNFRFLPVLGVLPFLHIAWLAIQRMPATLPRVTGAVVQGLLLAFVMSVRITSMWMLGLLAAAAMFVIARRAIARQSTGPRPAWWPLLVVMVCLVAATLAQSVRVDPVYASESETAGHLKWHNVFVGLAVEPLIARDYSGIDAMATVCGKIDAADDFRAATRQFLCARPGLFWWTFGLVFSGPSDQMGYLAAVKRARELGRPDDYVVDGRGGYKWRNYEETIAIVTKDVIVTHPWRVLHLHTVLKPFHLLRGYVKYAGPENWLPVIFMLPSLLCVWALAVRSPGDGRQVLGGLLLITCIASTLPAFVAYPTPHAMPDFALLVTMCLLGAVVAFFVKRSAREDSQLAKGSS